MRNELMRWSCGLALLLVAIAPGDGIAQGPAAATLVEGRRSIQLGGIDDGAASLGFWRMRDARTNLGIVVDADLSGSRISSDTSDAHSTSIGLGVNVGPEIRRYTSLAGRVAPYGFLAGSVGASLQRHSSEDDSDTRWAAGVGGRIGLGAEYFPTESLSIGGQMGVGASLNVDPEPADDVTRWSFDVGTFGASITAAIYF